VECRVLLVSVSGYHQHMRRRKQIAQRRHLSDAALLVHIRAVFAAHRGAYCWPRVWRQLLSQDVRVGKSRVQRLMQLHNIRARSKRRFRIATTDSRHGLPIAPNLLDRNFTPDAPNRAWAGDVTYIPTEEGWLFLSVVMDLFSRRFVGWSMQDNMRSEIVVDALEMAWFQRSPDKNGGLIFHSDCGSQYRGPRGLVFVRGVEYASREFNQVLSEHRITPSMSRKGNCWDNACSETLFGSTVG